MKRHALFSFSLLFALSPLAMAAHHATEKTVYADFPITTKAYSGDKLSSVSYKGQIARQVLQSSLKKLASQGNGSANPDLKAKMLAYYEGKDDGRAILDPVSKDKFAIKQTKIENISGKTNLEDKTYKGAVAGWPGNMTGVEVLEFMIDKASAANQGYDPLTGYDYAQLISKFAMGAILYNQAVDNYLDEKLAADKNPNDKPYKKGAAYTGKEHVWDEAFGYFGTPANTLMLTAEEVYNIAKQKPEVFAKADANKDGVIDLTTEMAFGYAYYAADFDKGGKTNYLHTITKAFVDGRQLITHAKGNALSDKERSQLKSYAETIAKNWEKVIAEAVFKYAGETYEDLQKLKTIVESNGNPQKAFRAYAKHWGELKGFSLALQTGKNNLGETAVKLNRLIGFSPVLLGNTQVVAVDANNEYVQSSSENLDGYMLHMLKVQKLMVDTFDVKAKSHDALSNLSSLSEKLGSGKSAEND